MSNPTPPDKAEPCPRCHGEGAIFDKNDTFAFDCPDCNGTGVTPPADTPKPRTPQFEIVDGVLQIYGDHLVTDDPMQAEFWERQGVEVMRVLEGSKKVYYIGREAVKK